MGSKKIETIYYNGQPDGVRIIRNRISPITCYVIPRPLLSQAMKISYITNPGIYYLINEDDDNKITQMYIGQTRNGVLRLIDHNRQKSFWNKAIMFLSSENVFSLDILSGLEVYSINKAISANRYKIENTVNPKFKIDEYDLPTIEQIYDDINFLMATNGYKLDEPKKETKNILHTSRRNVLAYGIYNGEKFQLLEGSEIDITNDINRESLNQKRKQMIDDIIVKKEDKYYLTKTLEFSSPSAASTFALGGSTNGWVEWKNEENITLDELIRKE